MTAPDADPDTGPVVTLIGRLNDHEKTNEALYEELKNDTPMTIGPAQAITVRGVAGLAANISGENNGKPMRGRAALVMVTPFQQFILMVGAPQAQWAEVAPYFDAVLASIEFFEPVAAGGTGTDTPFLGLPSGWTLYSDANEVRGLVYHENVLYAAGLGGVVTWNLATGTGIKYTTRDGLSHISARDAVYCEIPLTAGATPSPAILVATDAGISHFDLGTRRWSTLNVPLEGFPNSARVDRLFCDAANGRLLLSSDGLGMWDSRNNTWQRLTDRDGLTWNQARGIAVRGDEIWVGSGYNGVSVVKGGQVTATYDESSGLPDNKVHSIALGSDGQTLWMGTGKGLVKFSGGQWTVYGPDAVDGMPRGNLTYVTAAPDGALWIGSETGVVCRFDPAAGACTESYRAETPNPFVSALTVDAAGNAYFADGRTGIHYLSGGEWEALTYAGEPLASNFVDGIGEDAAGMVWIGTNGGLQRLDPADPSAPWQTFRKEDGTGGGRARSIALGPDGALWFAMVNGDATRYADGQWTVKEGLRSANVVTADAQGRGWFGTNDGVVIWDGQSSTTLGEADGLPNARVNALLADGEAMWIGTGGGLARWQGGRVEVALAKDTPALNGGYIQALARLDDGSLLIGAMGGLAHYDGAQATSLAGAGAGIRSIAVAPTGRIWVSARGGLLYSDNGGQMWNTLTTADGLPTNFVNTVFVDRFGMLWISGGGDDGGGGLARYVP